jgi:hypothetical protein
MWRSAVTLVLLSFLPGACGHRDTPLAIYSEPAPPDSMPPQSGPQLEPGELGDAGSPSFEQCVVYKQQAHLAPVFLLFLLDQSGTMGDGHYGDPTLKWDPVASALKAFFADSRSAGLNASLTLFPPDLNQSTAAASSAHSGPELCDPQSYETPTVPVTSLPEPEAFAAAIDAVAPPNEWGTPTELALRGALAQAKQLLADVADAKIAIILVTDGEPAQCSGQNSLSGTVELSKSVAGRIATHVVGVGNTLGNLDQIAQAGGTERAFIVPVEDPSATQRTLLDTFATIMTNVVPCEAEIPRPPPGKTFEKEKVAVEYSLDGMTTRAAAYNADCAGGEGWHYDTPGAPRSIELCESTCQRLQAQSAATLVITFACQVLLSITK